MKELKMNVSEAWQSMYDKIEGWGETIVLQLPNLVIAAVVFTISLGIAKYTSSFLQRVLQRTSLQKSMRRVIGRMSAFVIISIALFLILGILDLSKTLNTVLAGAGVLGLAVGLALQSALANTYSGIVLSYIKNIKVGDWVKSNDYEGEVVEIDFRSMTLKQIDNNLVYVPNKLVIESPFKNYSSTAQSRVILECGVGYGSDLELVKRLTVQAIIDTFDVPTVEEDVLFLYREFGGSAINFEIRFWINSSSGLEVAKAKSKAIMLIKSVYKDNNINIPFPMRTLDLGNQIDAFFDRQKEEREQLVN